MPEGKQVEATVDLHGAEKQPFPDFTESVTYLERVTVPVAFDAAVMIREEYGFRPDDPEVVEVRAIHMRWVESIDRDNEPELDNCEAPCWVECDESDEGAVPFWKETP